MKIKKITTKHKEFIQTSKLLSKIPVMKKTKPWSCLWFAL